MGDKVTRYSTNSSKYNSLVAAFLIAAVIGIAPGPASATPVTSAANIAYSGVSPGGVDMATGELILVMRPDLAIDGPFPVQFRRYYASMLAREGFASGHLGPNWLGTYDWSLSVAGPIVNVVTNGGQRIQFQQGPVGGWNLLSPTDENYRLDFVGGMWRLTHPGIRQVLLFDGTSHLLTQILDEHGNGLSLGYSGGRLSQVTDGLGRTLSFSYDGSGNLIQVGDGTRSVSYSYTSGLLTGVTDAAGHTWTYVYAQPGPIQGLLVGVTEPLGNTPLTQTYDPQGRVMSQSDAFGGMAMYNYDAPSGNVFMDPLANASTYLHDTQNRLMTLTDPAAGATSFTYDPLGRLATMTRPLGDMTSFAYDAASGYPNSITLGDGSMLTYTYGSHSVSGASLFDLSTAHYPDGAMESYGRDGAGNLADFTDRGDFHWFGTYNSRGQVLTATNPSSGVATFTYDPLGRPATGRDNAGNTTSFTYDALSRLTQCMWPDGPSRSFGYNNLDDVTTFTDERGKQWSYGYDNDGRLTSNTDPLTHQTQLVWDLDDRLSQVIDPLSHATAYGYDPAGRLASMTDRTGNMTSYQYDALGRLIHVIDPAGGTSSCAYDADSRVTAMQDPLGHGPSYTYDALDRPIHANDPVGSPFDYSYDTMGRLLSANAPLGHTETFAYDARGLLRSYFDVTSETDLAHTPLGEVSRLTDPNRNAWPSTYDPQGRPASDADPLGRTTTYAYDSRSRATHAELPLGSVNLTFDAASRLTARAFSDGTAMSYTYDDANRLTGATGASFAYDAAGRMISSNGFLMTYDNEGRITSETYAPGKAVTYSYDTRGLLSQVTDWLGGVTTFSYDAACRLSTMSRPPPNGIVTTYQYDNADRLISSVESRPPPQNSPLSSITITRDALGRPTSIDRRQPLMPAVTLPTTTNFSYDAASQTNGFSWDPLGRLVSDGTRSFQWDGASRLTRFAAGADSPRFTYDAFGKMLTQTLGSQTVQLGWNYGHNPPTNDDTQVNLPTPKTSYNVYTPSGLLLYSIEGSTGARSFYHYDESGNTMFLTNGAGSVVTEYAYTPYGGVSALGSTGDNRFTWGGAAGVMQIGSTGLSRYGSAIFDATLKRVILGIPAQAGPRQQEIGPGTYVEVYGCVGQGEGVAVQPGPISSPGSWVTLNPQPFPPAPGSWVTTQPGPTQTPRSYSGNYGGNYAGNYADNYAGNYGGNYSGNYGGNYSGNYAGNYSGNSPASWVTANPGPQQSPGPTKIDWSGPGDEGPEESITFVYGALKTKYELQTPGSEEVHTDRHGRIKVAFHWDRLGNKPTDGVDIPENSAPIGSATGGAGSGKRKFHEFVIDKTPDSASPVFFKNCVAGAHYKTIIIHMRHATGDPSPWALAPANPWIPPRYRGD